MYNVKLPDGTLVQVPDNVPEDEARRRIRKQFPQFASKERTAGEAVKDVGTALLHSAGNVLQVPGQLAQLVPGLYGIGSALTKPGAAIADYASGLKSQGLQVREALSNKAVSEAAKNGILAEFGEAIWQTIKDPALLSTFLAEQLPQLIGPAAAVKVARLATASKVAAAGEGLAGIAAKDAIEAAAKSANVTANRAAMGAGAAMQGADVSSDTFNEAMAYLAQTSPNMPEEQRRDIALNAARKAGAIGLAASGLSMALPGAQAIEKRLAGIPGVGRIKSALGESGQEIIEEGGGQFGKNVAMQPIDPTRELLQGVGSAAGLGAIGGGILGGAFGNAAPPPELMEGQMAGETARQSAERLQQEINDLQGLKAIQAQQDAEAERTGLGAAMTAKMPQPGETPLRPPRPSSQELAFNNLLATTPEEEAGPTGIASAVSTPERGVAAPSSISGRAAVDSMMVPTDRALPAPVPTGYAPALGGIQSVLPQRADRPASDRLPDFNQVMAQEADPFVATVGIGEALGGIEPSLPSRPVPNGTPTFNQLMAQDKAIDRGIASAVQTAIRKNTASEAQGPATPILKQPEPTFVSGLDTIVKGGKGSPSQETAQGPATPIIPVVPPAAPEAGVQGIIKGGKGQAAGQQNTAPATPVMPQKPPESGVSGVIKAAAGQPSTVQGPLGQPLLPQTQEAGLASAIKGGRGTPTKTTSPSNVNNLNVPEATNAAIQQKQAAKGNENVGTAGGASVPVAGGQGVQPTTAGAGKPEGGGVGVPKPDAGGAAGRKAKQSSALKKSLAATETEAAPEIEDEAVDKQIALKTKQLQAIMLRIMSGMGLRDVGLKLVADMDAEGEYANQLITLALNVDSPVRVLRHESIHAMKAMGLFSPQQWETLRKEASTKWIKQFLGEGEDSRFEQYQKLFKDQGLSDADANEAMIEEAIADAFGQFDLRGAPSGLMSAILKRMQNMFAAIKSAFGGTETAEQILQRAEKGKLQGKAVPTEGEAKASLRRPAVPDETEISTQNPQAVNRRYDPIEQMLSIDQKAVEEAMELNPELYDSITDAILRYGFIPPDTKREDAIAVFKKNIVNNLLFLHDAIPKDIANRSKLWYDGAHIIAKEMAKQYGMKMEQVAGIFAAMSPQKDWFQNVSMGERAIDILTNQGDATWDDNMLKYAESYIREPKDRKEREKRQIFFDKNIRQTSEDQTALKDMDIENAAAFIRAFDEAYNSRQYRIVTPEGGFAGLVNKKDGDSAIMTWSTYSPIEKAVSIFRDPSRKNISEQLGEEHKIRSFYNNIAAPNADIDHVTIDTHAVAAGLFEALAGSDKPVAENFGSTGGTNLLGVGGTYGIIADAYREAAKARSIQAREMQSITWEAIRGLFTEELKSGIKSDVRAEWEKYKAGEQSFNEARDAIVKIASKNRDEDWRDPDWIDSGPGQTVAEGGASYDKDFEPEGGVRLREEGKLREKVTFNLSAVTRTIPGLQDLYQKAMSGDDSAYATLQKVAESSLKYLLSGTSARVKVEYAKGVFLSDKEPALLVSAAFTEEDKTAVLAALERFASNYNQEQIHVRQPTAYKVGHTFDDQSYVTPVYAIDLAKDLSNADIDNIINQSGLIAFTIAPLTTKKGTVNQLTVYWCKQNDQSEEEQNNDFNQFKAKVLIAQKLAGVSGARPKQTVERLYAYGRGDTATHGYERIKGDVRPKQGADTETPRIIADYIRGGAGTVVPPKKLNKFQVLGQKLLASVQEALPVNDLKKPLVRKAYNAANVEIAKQFAALPVKVEVVDTTDKPGTFYYDGTYKSGTPAKGEIVAKDEAEAREQLKQQAIDVDKIRQRPEPYANSAEMRKDVSNNNVLKILKTQAGSFGPEGVPMSDHPLLEMSDFKDINNVPLLYNDMLRAVHDYYAHGVTPAEFGPVGEATAWLNHMATTMSPLARWVITAETRLQNAWQNFRPGVENIPLADRPYALQKAALPPVQFALTGKADIDAPMLEFINTLTPKQQLGSLSEKSPLVKKIGPATAAKFSIRAPNTKEFKQWFGRSTIVDAEGNPKVMYHGTARDITAFRAKQANAIFITEEPTLAENYAYASADWMAKNEADFFTPEEKADARRQVIESLQEQNKGLPKSSKDFNKRVIAFLKTGNEDADSDVKDFAREALIDVYVGEVPRGANILPVFVKSENPFDYENPEHLAKIEPIFRANENGSLPRNAIQNGLWSVIESDGVQKAIRASGFDGFYVEEGGIKNLAVYNPEQIKSATGNQGTFDIKNPDIRKSLRNTVAVDENGQPKLLYHSTYSAFDEPKVNYGADEYRRFGFHVGPLEAAQSRLGIKASEDKMQGEKSGNAGANIIPVYLNIQAPLRLKENRSGRWGVDDVMSAIMNSGEVDPELVDKYEEDALTENDLDPTAPEPGDEDYDPNADESRNWADQSSFKPGERSRLLTNFIQGKLGYDSIVYANKFEGGGDSYIALSPKQVKSQFRPEGKFSLRTKGEPVTKGNVVAAMERAYEQTPYMNCQLALQITTGVSKLRDLPKVKSAQVGDIYTFNETKTMASHYAVELGDGNVAEVEQWGEAPRVVPLQDVVAEYDEPSAIRRPPDTAYTEEVQRVKVSLRSSAKLSDDRIDALVDNYGYWQSGSENDTRNAYISLIKPKDFLNSTSTEAYRKVLESEKQPLNADKLAKGEMPHLRVKKDAKGNYQILSHEGRHRMMALRDSGVQDAVPVLVLPSPIDGRTENAPVIEGPYFKPQVFSDGPAVSGAYGSDMVPITWNSRAALKKNFGGEADVKFSLRSTLPAALIQRVDQTTVAREDKGFISRILKAISPGDHTSIRAELLNRYNQLSVIDKMRIKKMGGAAAMADISAESAALLSDLSAGITASALGVHDKVGGAPVYVQSFYVVRNGQILPRRYKTRALAQASAGPGGEVRSGGHTAVVNFNGGVKGPLAIFAPLAAVNDPMIYQLYQFWAAAKRGKRLTKEGREELLNDPADQAHAKFLENKYGVMFNQVQKDFIKYNDKLVDYMVDTGVLSPERGKIYTEHADYLPFYRQIEGQATAGPKIFAAISGVKPPKALKGSDARLDDFLETIVRNTQSAIQAGVKNVAAQRSVEAAKDVGLAVKIPQGNGMPTTVVVHENGVPTYYACGDVAFINAMKSLGMSDIPFLSILSMPANFLRAAVTKEPTFMLANMLRDSLSAYVTSGVSMTPVIDTAKNFAMSMAGKSPEYDALRRAGILGGYEFAQGVETSGRRLGEKLKKANVKSTGFKRAGELAASPFTGVWQLLEKGSEASDAATRIEIYKRTLAETGNETEALFKSLEVMNFNRKGRAASVRILTAVVPFLNARMQGLDILYRAAIQPSMPGQSATDREKELQHKFLVRGATMAALSCLYWALTHDDDEYKKQEQDTKDNYWLFPSMGIKIPIPFEIGVLFKVIPERIMALAFGDDSFKDFRNSMTNQVISTLNFNPIPQAIIPVVENITNHSFYTGRDIVSPGVADLQTGYQTAASTSSLMSDFGRATGLSPIKLEHAIQGYTGQMGMYLVSALDAMYEANSTVERPAKRFEQLPLIKRFAIDPEARGSVTSFFELKDQVDTAVKTANMLERGDPEVYDKYIEDNQNLLASKDYINALASDMKDLAKMKVMIRASDDSAEVKKDALLEIQQLENDMTENMQELKREFTP